MSGELVARAYEPRDASSWDAHVRASRTPHPMLERGWVEYHADRFRDASLVVTRRDRPDALVAVLPASAHGERLVSHGGLSFGGVVTTRKVGAARMLDIMRAIVSAARERGFSTLSVKAVPHIFHTEPAEEELYALTRAGARLVRRDMSAAIDLTQPVRYAKGRRWALKRADERVALRYGDEYEAFVELETQVLKRHGVAPVHSAPELALLAARFPGALRLLGAWDDAELLGATVTISTPTVVHTQYIGASERGRERGVVDRLIDHVIAEHQRAGRRWLSFGISTERDGAYLNEGLAAHKESFGARGIVYDHYELALDEAEGRLDG